jgi:hypothetical protein
VAAARAALDQKIGRASKLRKVSLTALEAEIGKSLAENRQLSEAMKHLAGLTRVQDPTQEGLRDMQRFLMSLGAVRPGDAPRIVEGLKTSLGLQKVSIRGVSPRTHFAQVLVEADYRMKMIGIGLENPGVGIVSYEAKANPATVAQNALKRW